MFCLNYADIPQDVVPRSPGVYNMMRLAEDGEIFLLPDENLVNSGNLLFMDTDANGKADRLAIGTDYDEEEDTITAISGDWDDAVAEITLAADDPMIMGYIDLRQVQARWEAKEEEKASEVTDPADEMLSAEPSISLDMELL